MAVAGPKTSCECLWATNLEPQVIDVHYTFIFLVGGKLMFRKPTHAEQDS